MGEHLEQLKERLATVHSLNRALAVLSWDQQTYMPHGGAEARGVQMGTLSKLAHELFVDDDTGRLLEAAAAEVAHLPTDSDDASLVRVARKDYDQDRKIPPALVSEMVEHGVRGHEAWVRARQENDFASFAPYLTKTVDLSRRIADYLGYEEEMYDALLDQFEPGMKTSQVTQIFADLKAELIPLVAAISAREDRVTDAPLHQNFDEAQQEAFGKMLAAAYGYDFNRGRQDRAPHPFETTFSRNDVRITTRFDPQFLNSSLFGTLHETGHAMYEQNTGESLEGTLLGRGASLGIHESQSRMWENVVGRSLPFWQHFYPQLQAAFPDQLGSVDLQTFYGAINRVHPSYIRVEADEVTYNLHILLRFEMERDLLNGAYGAEQAPEVWNSKMEEYLGVRPPTNAAGILQDMHWAGGMMGYFPTYSLGNILSVQLYDAAVRAAPTIPEEIASGRFDSLRNWLIENVYQYGRKYEPNDLITRATGQPLHSGPYLAYLKGKFGELYGLDG